MVDLACRTALSYRGVAHITIPVDFQEEKLHSWERSKRNIGGHTNAIQTQSYKIPDQEQLRGAAEILNAGKKVAIMAGRGAIGSADQIEQVAELLGAPIVKPLLGKSSVPDDSPYTTGSIGLLGTAPSQEALETCDTLLMVGTSFPYLEYLPNPGQAKAVQIDLDPKRNALRYPVDVG
jgi:pyruvate dehydrogenase (quinone)/pyruvate oxidase